MCRASEALILRKRIANGHTALRDNGLYIDMCAKRLHYCATLKTATVRDLRNRYTSVLRWVSAGEDVLITQRGIVIARLSPETAQSAQVVDWASSPEVLRDRSQDHVLSAEQSAEIQAEAGGRW